jgi:hypothetical protein
VLCEIGYIKKLLFWMVRRVDFCPSRNKELEWQQRHQYLA